jgi:hypothetical protein
VFGGIESRERLSRLNLESDPPDVVFRKPFVEWEQTLEASKILLNAATHLSQWSRRNRLPIPALAIAGGVSIGLLQGLVLGFGMESDVKVQTRLNCLVIGTGILM